MLNQIETSASASHPYHPENNPTKPLERNENSAFSAAADEVLFSSPDPSAGLHLFFNRVEDALGRILDFQNRDSAGPYQMEASPTSLAGRFLKAIESGTNNPISEAGDDFMTKIETGLAQGYQQTLMDFSGTEYPRDVMDAVNRAHELIRQGIEDIKTKATGLEGGGYSYQAAAFDESSNLSLKILTRDGDTVVIDIHQAAGQGASFLEKSDADGVSMDGKQYRYVNESLAFSINGNLDEDEIGAINELIANVADLAQTFYSSDLEKTVSRAASLGFDTSELSGFALNMDYQRSQYAAIAEQNRSSERMPSQGPGADQMPADIAGYLRQAMDRTNRLMNDPGLARIDRPQQLIRDLFKAIGAQLQNNSPEGSGSKSVQAPGHIKQTLLADLMDTLASGGILPGIPKNIDAYI